MMNEDTWGDFYFCIEKERKGEREERDEISFGWRKTAFSFLKMTL